MSNEREKTLWLTPANSAALLSEGCSFLDIFCFNPGVAKPFLSSLRARRVRSLPVAFHASRYPRWGCDEPHQREMYFANGDANGLGSWGEATFASQVHREQ